MDWYKVTLLVMCLIVVVSSPMLLVKASRRREKSRLFDIVLSDVFLAYLAVQAFWPSVTLHLPASARWLLVALTLLFLANMFGLSRRLFKKPGTNGSTPQA